MAMASSAKFKTGPEGNINTILDKLLPNIHNQLFGANFPTTDVIANRRRAVLVSRAAEGLRLLNIKRVHLLKDNAMVRAALVIDYLSRNACLTSSTAESSAGIEYMQASIPISMLANAIGFNNKKDVNKLQSMQTVIASYLDGTSIGKRNKRGRFTENDTQLRRHHHDVETSLSQSTSDRMTATTSTAPLLKPTPLIRQLCIKLGTMISDAEFVISYALRLFSEMQKISAGAGVSTTSSKRSRLDLYKDMERNQIYYEAACFYIAAMKSEGNNGIISHSSINDTTITSQRRMLKLKSQDGALNRGFDEEVAERNDEDEYYDRVLNEKDIIREANLLEDIFQTVLVCVRDCASEIINSSNSINRDWSIGTNGIGDGSNHIRSTKPQEKDRLVDNQKREGTNHSFDAVFEQWKGKVLHEAKMSALAQIADREQKDWLTVAAEEVLRKAGLE